MNSDDQDLSDQELRALRALPMEAPLPKGFEGRVVDALRRRGLIAVSRRGQRLLRVAAAAVLFAAGLGTGLLARPSLVSPRPTGPLYLLLLQPGPTISTGGSADEAARVEEYRVWAGALRREGRLLMAERLQAEARVLASPALSATVTAEGPQGFFLVRARDRDEAEAIARACPHLRHGGRVAVQAVDPT